MEILPSAKVRREQLAEIIYESFPFSATVGTPEKPKWTAGGNGLMQDKARRAAETILSLQKDDPAILQNDPSPTLWGQIRAVYGALDDEDCAWIDREWIKFRGMEIRSTGRERGRVKP